MKNLRVLQTFFQKPLLSLADLKNSGIALEKRMFVSVGGGIGSFCWVDGLRVHAVAQDDIAVISHHRSPYQQFKQYCDRSGLCPQDRLRSDSSARPDNFWGFPGYAVDEWWDNLRTGHWSAAGKVAWQIFSEPLLADFYTPTAGRLYASMEREMGRIGWASMVRQGTALFIRKLDDQRYAVFYRAPTRHFHIIIANVVHLALGHTVKQADYLHTKTTDQVLSGYALQDDFFRCVEETHASVVVVGRGIVAARIIEQLLPKDPQVSPRSVISLLRSPLEANMDSRQIEQASFAGWRLQPFNWPRATFGGPLMETLQAAPATKRRQLAKSWSAASTPPRTQWLRDLKKAAATQSYRTVYGQIARIEPEAARLAIQITPASKAAENPLTIQADYLIDCSGFDDQIAHHFIYTDLMATYQLPTTPAGSLQVNPNFEVETLSTPIGKVIVSGSGAAGNHYGPVDSFLGHQYAAVKTIESLSMLPWTKIRQLNPVSSVRAWLQWLFNRPI